MLEAHQYSDNAFVTLTYSDDNLPHSLDPKHVQNWLKRLRRRVEPKRFRFFMVGEYSDDMRPHYHAALFGFPSCAYGQSRYSKFKTTCCYWCELVRNTWGYGHVYLGTLEPDSAQYICGYVTKKMTRTDDPRLDGRWPEFARMSLRPGIGRDALWEVADVLMQYGLDQKLLDVPLSLAHGRRQHLLGRYLRKNLRRLIGKDEKTPQQALDEIQKKLLALQARARASKNGFTLKKEIVIENEQRYRNFVSRQKLKGLKNETL